jgi:hypothetical protein
VSHHLILALPLSWIEGSRGFSIAFGTVTAFACLAVGLPILNWSLPSRRRWIFSKQFDRALIFQVTCGVMCMSMAFADALCRYIPHRPLGIVHPAFLLTTVALVALLAPRVAVVVADRAPAPVRLPGTALAALLAVLAVIPISAVINAFWF